MDAPEVIVNLWFVYDNTGFIYALRGRAYVGYGSDDEKLALLRRFATTDYLIAQVFPVPERFHMKISDGANERKLPAGHTSVMQMVGYAAFFEDVMVELEKQLPIQSNLSIGQHPLMVVTPLYADDDGTIYPKFTKVGPAGGMPG